MKEEEKRKTKKIKDVYKKIVREVIHLFIMFSSPLEQEFILGEESPFFIGWTLKMTVFFSISVFWPSGDSIGITMLVAKFLEDCTLVSLGGVVDTERFGVVCIGDGGWITVCAGEDPRGGGMTTKEEEEPDEGELVVSCCCCWACTWTVFFVMGFDDDKNECFKSFAAFGLFLGSLKN